MYFIIIIQKTNINLDKKKEKVTKGLPFKIPKQGSLGLLAYGDIGLRAWRKVKAEFFKKDSE